MRVLVVVPTYLEAENIELFLRQLRADVPDADVLVVDDSSPDATADLAEKAGADLGRISVLRRARKDGLGNAYRAGFGQGLEQGYDVLVQMDADFSHDPAVVPKLLATIDEGADVVIGSRYVPGGATPDWPAHRRWLSKWGNRYATALLGLQLRDATAGFRAYRREALRRIRFETTRANGYAFQMEVARRLAQEGLDVREIPITFLDRTRGKSKMSTAIMAESMSLVTWWGLRDRAKRRLARARNG